MSLNILVVDDEESIRKIIIKSLVKSGLKLDHIYEAANGKTGLKILAENNIDFALIDYHMPVMDGKEMLDMIRNEPDTKDLPVVLITADANSQEVAAISQKNVGVIGKPFSPTTLGEVVMNMITDAQK
jgi:two-component system chemotaxis response regulator CheY